MHLSQLSPGELPCQFEVFNLNAVSEIGSTSLSKFPYTRLHYFSFLVEVTHRGGHLGTSREHGRELKLGDGLVVSQSTVV